MHLDDTRSHDSIRGISRYKKKAHWCFSTKNKGKLTGRVTGSFDCSDEGISIDVFTNCERISRTLERRWSSCGVRNTYEDLSILQRFEACSVCSTHVQLVVRLGSRRQQIWARQKHFTGFSINSKEICVITSDNPIDHGSKFSRIAIGGNHDYYRLRCAVGSSTLTQ